VYYDWDRLEPDREYENIIIAQNTPSFFRFHWTEDCKAFQVILKLNYGQVAYFLNSPSSPSPKPPAYDNHNLFFRTKLELDNNPVVVCPSSSGFELGTWTIGIYAYTSKANFSLEIRSYDVRTLEQRDLLPSAKPSKKCRPHSPEHICIGTDSASRFSLPDPSASQTEDVAALFQVTVEECTELHIWTELIEAAPGWNSFDPIKDSNALDIWVMAIGGENDPFPDTRNNTYGPTANYWALGGDTFIEVCPGKGKGSANLFVGIWASFNSTYWLFVETYRTSWNRVPISRLYDNTYFNLATLFGSASLQCQDDVEFICNPASLIGYDSCFQFYPYLSNPFARMPTPIRLLSDFYREVNPIHEETVISDLRVSDKTISFALILQLGTTVYFPEWQKRLHSCNMILPSFSPISSTSGKVSYITIHPECPFRY
jgi:hypothetical protein